MLTLTGVFLDVISVELCILTRVGKSMSQNHDAL